MSRSLEFFGNEILDNNNWADNVSIARRVTLERERRLYFRDYFENGKRGWTRKVSLNPRDTGWLSADKYKRETNDTVNTRVRHDFHYSLRSRTALF